MFTDPKRQRPPLQPQSGSNSSAYHHPSTEIALQQHMLRQQHSGGHSPMGSGSVFESLGQHSTDASQLQMHSQTTGLPLNLFLPACQHQGWPGWCPTAICVGLRCCSCVHVHCHASGVLSHLLPLAQHVGVYAQHSEHAQRMCTANMHSTYAQHSIWVHMFGQYCTTVQFPSCGLSYVLRPCHNS